MLLIKRKQQLGCLEEAYFAFGAEETRKSKDDKRVTLLSNFNVPNMSSLAKRIKNRHADIFKGFPEVVVSSPFIIDEA